VGDLAADPLRPRVYATVPSDNTVIVIDTATLGVTKTIPIGSMPQGLAVSLDGQKLWVANSGSTTAAIGVIDLNALTTLPSLAAPARPFNIVEGLEHRLYLSPADQSGGIMQIDWQTGMAAPRFGGFEVYVDSFLAITPDRRTLFLGSESGYFDKFDVSTKTPSLLQQVRFGGNASGVAVSHDGQFVVFPNGGGNGGGYTTFEIPAADITGINGSFAVGPYPLGATFSNDDTLLYHGTSSQNTVKIFDTKTFTLVGTVLVRALGPTLTQFGVNGALANPRLDLFQGQTLIASNDDWTTAPNASQISASGYAPPNGSESAILTNLDPGNYTAIVRGVNGSTGVALVESYDLDGSGTSKLGNISTRGFVKTGNDVMIAGVVVKGSSGQTMIIRGLGPTLSQFGVHSVLADPFLDLRDINGNQIRANNNWKTNQQNEIQATGYAPPADSEAAILTTLPPGNDTAILSGVGNTSGNALVEVYALN
jgi:YVTN family beta-propeller protein